MNDQRRFQEALLPRLPPELIQPVIKHVLITTELCHSIKLRLVNKMFDSEVMAVIEDEKLLKDCAAMFQDDDGNAKFRSDFMASYLLRRPHEQSPWNANISSMLNKLVDDILILDGLSLDANVRHCNMLVLSQVVRQQNLHQSVIPRLFPPEGVIPEELPYEYLLLLAQIITGRPVLQNENSMRLIDSNLMTRPYILGTLVNSAIWGHQYDLFRYLLSKEVQDGGRYQLAGATVHRALPAAILNRDIKAVEIILEPAWWHPRSGPAFEEALRMSIQLGHLDVTSLLEQRRE